MDVVGEALVALGRRVRDRIRAGLAADDGRLAAPAAEGVGDLQYALDVLVEEDLVAAVGELFVGQGPLRLLSEGLSARGEVVFDGDGGRLLVVDPIDGTRGLMHDKRSAFFLAGIAPDGPAPRLRELTHSCLVELPFSRSHLSDVMVLTPDGVDAWTDDLLDGSRTAFAFRPSGATDLEHGFATVSRFIGGAHGAIGAFHDAFLEELMPSDPDGWMGVFEDQYICNGGQMYALMTGRDRFVADVRPLFPRTDGGALLCSHPYDLLALPIAEAAGVVVTDPGGDPLDAPLDLHTNVAWIGYASQALRSSVEPSVQAALARVRSTDSRP